DQGAFISVSHPFDKYRKGAWRKDDLDRIIDQVDAIETFNARCLSMTENRLAQEYAAEHNLCGTTGSDAHTPVEYGTATQLMQPFSNADEFRQSLQTAEPVTKLSSPRVHFNSTFAKWSRKLGITKRPRP
ncbi:MAG: PHP domain-containing protein, partial [Chloroflexota bacterium]